jgi:glycosyltransferase involved in cell wall biosynthesis/putative flippase GtrA
MRTKLLQGWAVVSAVFMRHQRQLRYMSVSVLCFSLQYVLLKLFVRSGLEPAWVCNAAAFFLSTQVNCALSQVVTWKDRQTSKPVLNWKNFLPYNAIALVSLLLNSLGFYVAHNMTGVLIIGQLAGAVLGMLFTYRICNQLLFRRETVQMDVRKATTVGLTPQPVASRAGVAITMPAHNEADNIQSTVEDFLYVLKAAGIDHTVVACNDGSNDQTGPILDDLVSQYPGRVVAVHHCDAAGQPRNQGYGAAVRSALDAGLATGHQWVLTTDSDGQFRAADLPGFIDQATAKRADVLLGYRLRRADPLRRRLMGAGWTSLCRLVLRIGAKDVDCAYKLIAARQLAGLQLRGGHAVISPELIAKSCVAGAYVRQQGVNHYPREYGQQSGSNLGVVLRSLLGLIGIYADLVRDGNRLRRVRRLVLPRDRMAYAVTMVAAVVGLASLWVFYHRNQTLAYPDAVSHLIISRRVLDSPTPSLAQLGAVWLPVPHLFALWGVWSSSLFYNGLSGSLISVASFVVAARYLYKLAAHLTGRPACGVVAAGVLVLNLNLLYMQSTPMTETPLLACVIAAVYYLTKWCETANSRSLGAASIAAVLGVGTRYEAWVLFLAMLVVVVYVEWRRLYPRGRNAVLYFLGVLAIVAGVAGLVAYVATWRHMPADHVTQLTALAAGLVILGLGWVNRRHVLEMRASLIYLGFFSAVALVGWGVWNFLLTGDPFYFQSGGFAKPSLWVTNGEKTIGNLGASARTYWIAVVDNIGLPVVICGLVGLAYYVVRTRLRPAAIAPLTLLVFAPFFVYSLYVGQRPLHVPEVSGNYYNVRFGLIMLLAAALFTGYLSHLVLSWRPVAARRLAPALSGGLALAAVAALAWFGHPVGIVTQQEGLAFRQSLTQQHDAAASAWLRRHYDGGLVLMENFSNETVTFASHIPTSRIVYEGSNKRSLWSNALHYPRQHDIRWIYMRTTPVPDDVTKALARSPVLRAYELVYRGPDQAIYRLGHTGAHSDSPSTNAGITSEAATLSRPTIPGLTTTPKHRSRPPVRALGRVTAYGSASWYNERPDRCDTNAAAIGAVIKVVNTHTGKAITCRVRGPGPAAPGRVVNLTVADFAQLAPLGQGIVPVKIVTFPYGGPN